MVIPTFSDFKEVYSYRYMLYALVKRNLKGKYNNSFLGFIWHFITPAISVILFYIVFGTLNNYAIEDYWAYLCVGMFAFNYLNTNIIDGTSCITSNGGMIKKMYFPREILVLSQVIYTFIIFLISYAMVIGLLLISGIRISIDALWIVPLNIILMVVFTVGITMLISSISAYISDLGHLIVAFARVLFWVTPIFYTVESTSGGILGTVIWCNPMTYFIVIMQDALYYGTTPSIMLFLMTTFIAVVVLLLGWFVFNKLKKGFAERI